MGHDQPRFRFRDFCVFPALFVIHTATANAATLAQSCGDAVPERLDKPSLLIAGCAAPVSAVLTFEAEKAARIVEWPEAHLTGPHKAAWTTTNALPTEDFVLPLNARSVVEYRAAFNAQSPVQTRQIPLPASVLMMLTYMSMMALLARKRPVRRVVARRRRLAVSQR